MDTASLSFLLTTGLVIWLIGVLSFWQLFVKAGFDGWKSIIPIYNTFILTKIAKQPTWVFIMLFLPLLNFIALIMIAMGLSEAFGKGFGMTLALIFFPFFGYMYLGWGESQYQSEPAQS